MFADAIESGRKPRLNAIRFKRSVNLFTAAILSNRSLEFSIPASGRIVATSSSDEIMSFSSSSDILISSAGISLAVACESILPRSDFLDRGGRKQAGFVIIVGA